MKLRRILRSAELVDLRAEASVEAQQSRRRKGGANLLHDEVRCERRSVESDDRSQRFCTQRSQVGVVVAQTGVDEMREDGGPVLGVTARG